jgi:hypothetical protein
MRSRSSNRDPVRRRRAQSEYGGSDTGSIRSFGSSNFNDAASIKSSSSFRRSPKRRYASSVSSWAAGVESEEPTSRRYGNYLAERDSKSLRSKSVAEINAETDALRRRRLSLSSNDASPRNSKSKRKPSVDEKDPVPPLPHSVLVRTVLCTLL